jgi:hypothetical protein
MDRALDLLVWFYNQRAGAENLIKEANNDAGLAAHPSLRLLTYVVRKVRARLQYGGVRRILDGCHLVTSVDLQQSL